MTDLEHESAVNRLHQRLRRRGVIRALRSAGAKPGAVVRIRDFEFEFVE
jgi:GTP-binding protein